MSRWMNVGVALIASMPLAGIADPQGAGRAPAPEARPHAEDSRGDAALHLLPRPTQLSVPRSKSLSA